MIETTCVRATAMARLRTGPAGPYLDLLTSALREQRYACYTIRYYLGAADAFGRWLCRQGVAIADADETAVSHYIASVERRPSRSRVKGRLPKAATGLRHLLEILRQQGVVTRRREVLPPSGAEQWLSRYDHYLKHALGSAPATRQKQLYFAKRFLATLYGSGVPDWSLLRAEAVTEFVQQEAARRRGFGRKSPARAIRSLLRYLVTQGDIPAGLEAAVPTISSWKLASLPVHLSAEEVARVIQACADGTPMGLRNHAILLLLARLGLRAKEVARLSLDDIDWTEGCLLIRAGKTHHERLLPLPEDVGQALITYLQQGRPASSHRSLFLQHTAPFHSLQTASAISSIVRHSLSRAGLQARCQGAHLFRHTIATQMVCRGASFKEVADVLGHQSLETTFIYAKLDLAALSGVALPWPGGVQ